MNIRWKRWISQLTAFFVSVVVAIALIPALATSGQAATTLEYVSPQWLSEHANDPQLRILDVRMNPLDYIQGHVPNAVHIADNTFRGPNGRLPIQYWEQQKLQSLFRQAGISGDSQVVVYSEGNNILGATMVAYLLERSGHDKIAVLDGGYKGYEGAGLPLTKEFPQYALGNFEVQDNTSTRVTLNDIRQAIGNPNITIIDPRPPALFSGEQNLFIRNGHIPGAKNIPWPTFTVGEANFHQLKPLNEIQALLDRRGITPDDDIIVSCSTGREATLQYTVLKHLLGYPKVRVYEGSWTEYSAQPDLPIETGLDPENV
ncbi:MULTISPECIES: sulfurtransferase [unclassified Leptolyngbya]|uniref:sulfurtransferase n=1 Tax=unclassified Leptolyngbya TaxID=2650499 RepID=UPI00168861FE|nr:MULTISPECIES: sulfurtransferase [unclassified Leptolyngbya]MBD1910877.1 sulfurtransferase [Leptolyngbya sp. FACHB-8]MBD2153728.1 sulfurtransferase [Leptolyngbya sp. FACHB-16]